MTTYANVTIIAIIPIITIPILAYISSSNDTTSDIPISTITTPIIVFFLIGATASIAPLLILLSVRLFLFSNVLITLELITLFPVSSEYESISTI